MLKAYLKYLKYVLEHKKNVFTTCWARGLYLHAITHDMSKFSPREFVAYARYYYISKDDFKAEFDRAKERHYKNNPHHWNYWLDEAGTPQPIPIRYLQQMIADWEGMALEFGDTAQEFYLNNYKKIKLEYNTRLVLELLLSLNGRAPNCHHTLEDFANMHNEESYNRYFGFIKDRYNIDTYTLLKTKKLS